MELIREFAGRERVFALRFGEVIDLEQACGDGKTPEGLAAIFQRLSTSRWRAKDVSETLRLALIGGGMEPIRARKLVIDHIDTRPWLEVSALAAEIVLSLMAGIEDAESSGKGDGGPIRFSEVSQICAVFNLSPLDLRAMRYADFVNMVRGYNAKDGKKAEPMSEDEFAELLAKYEPEA